MDLSLNKNKLKAYLNAHPDIFKNYVKWYKENKLEQDRINMLSELDKKIEKVEKREKGSLLVLKTLLPKQSEERLRELETVENLDDTLSLQNYNRILKLDNLMSLKNKTENLTLHHTDYQNIEFDDDSVIYCDPPYKGTKGYDGEDVTKFDSAKFWQWAEKVGEKHPIFISEIEAPVPFVCIWEKKKRNLANKEVRIKGHENFERTERLFTLPKWRHLARIERSLFDD